MSPIRVGPNNDFCGECGEDHGDGYEDLVHKPDCSRAVIRTDNSAVIAKLNKHIDAEVESNKTLLAELKAQDDELDVLRGQLAEYRKGDDTRTSTHSADCWRVHHSCAIARLDGLRATVEGLQRYSQQRDFEDYPVGSLYETPHGSWLWRADVLRALAGA